MLGDCANVSSMGGWTVLYYILKYPPTASTIKIAAEGPEADATPPEHGQGYLQRERSRDDEKNRVEVAGAFVMCPMVEGMCLSTCFTDESLQAVPTIYRHRVHWSRYQVLCRKSPLCQGCPRKCF